MTKGPNLQKIWDQLPDEKKLRIKTRTKKIEEEYLALQEIREKAGLTQGRLSNELNMRQENISQLEKNTDTLLSILRHHIETVGGKLKLTVELPGKAPIEIVDLSDLIDNTNNHELNEEPGTFSQVKTN